jgi:hypothetical protein
MKHYQINDTYRIVVDDLCYSLQEKKVTNKGEERWDSESYHARLSDLFSWLGNKIVKNDIDDLSKCEQQIKACCEEVLKMEYAVLIRYGIKKQEL